MTETPLDTREKTVWDHSSDKNFVDYYAEQSTSRSTVARFARVRDKVLKLHALESGRGTSEPLEVADIGCATGTQARLWAEMGHKVYGIDVNLALIEIARTRASEDGFEIEFDVGSATELPYANASMDVVLLPELLEHVADWQLCLREAMRILKPGGYLYVSTTNWLCPVQSEFNLPFYSWYPGFLKRRYEKLAVTTRPELANYCKYPAVNWFSYYSLAKFMESHDFRCLDRFDLMDTEKLGIPVRLAVKLLCALPPLRFIGQLFTSGSIVFAIKN